jgi:poly(3-hydroxybutyrate) depolymerase
MKKIHFTIILTVMVGLLYAQVPDNYKIQLLVNDNLNNTLMNKTIGIRLSILKGDIRKPVYSESLLKETNEFGLLSIDVGATNPNLFSQINWSEDIYFTKVELDITGGTNYALSGIAQLLEVPFAEYAKSSDKTVETDPLFQQWDKTTGIIITEKQISNLIHFKSANETDQKFTSSPAAIIKESELISWRSEENDPMFVSSPIGSVTATDTAKWSKKGSFSGSFDALTDVPVFSSVSKSGNYSELKNKPTDLVYSDITSSSNGIIQFNGSQWGTIPNGTPGQRLSVDASGLLAWKTATEEFNNADRPFFQYDQNSDYYFCTPWNYDKPINADRKYPLVVYLHYSGGAGDLSKLGLYYLGYDTNDGIDDDRAKNFQMNNPSFVIVPQTTTEFDISKIISLVEEYKTKYRIDQTRIYIIGYSLGGPASYSLANAYFDYNKQLFAGIIRLSGQSETTVRNEIANKTAIWLQVGLNDLALRVSITKDAYNFLKNYHSTAVESSQAVSVGGKSGITYTLTKNNKEIVKKTEYTDVGHDIMTFPFADGNLINWLFNQRAE